MYVCMYVCMYIYIYVYVKMNVPARNIEPTTDNLTFPACHPLGPLSDWRGFAHPPGLIKVTLW